MKISKTILTGMSFLVFASVSVLGEETTKFSDSTKHPVETKLLKNQTHCPVMGGPIDSTAFTDIQGQRVYHCCPMCTEKLTTDPDKFFKESSEKGILFENIQTNCPICGMKLDKKSIHSDFEGRRLFFCSDNCSDKFTNDPKGILDKMASKKEPQKGDDSQQDNMKNMEDDSK